MKDYRSQGPKAGGAAPRGDQTKTDEARLKMVMEGNAKELNSYADELARSYLEARKESEKLTTSQIRNALDEIQRLREFDENRLHLLRPKLAYAAGRHGGRVLDFQRLLDAAIKLTNRDNFRHFKNFVEAIVAYHRYHGGK